MALRYSSKGQSRHSQNILDRPIARPDKPYGETGTVSLSAFAYLFSEIISYHNSNIIKKNHTADDFNRRLVDLGFDVGTRLLELMTLRGLAQKYKRPTRLQDMLFFIVKDVWKCLFGEKVAVPDLNRANDDEYRYWIEDRSPSYIKYITVPKDYRGFHPASFIAGIVKGILDASGFEADVHASWTGHEDAAGEDHATAIVMTFGEQVRQREAQHKAS